MCNTKNTNLNHKNKCLKVVRNLQNRIFRAQKSGNNKRVKNLRKLLLRSTSNYITCTDSMYSQQPTLMSQNIKKMIHQVWEPKEGNTFTSPHRCIQKIKHLYKHKTNAVVFDLEIASNPFINYIKGKLNSISCKKQLRHFLVYNKSNKFLLLQTFSQILGLDFHYFATQYDFDLIYYHGKLIVFADDREICSKLYPFLEKRGFIVSHKKLISCNDEIDFLGFTISKKNNHIIAEPSAYEVKKHINHLSKLWKWARGKEINLVITKVNYVVKKWCEYFRYQQCSKTFKKIQMFQLKKQQKWATSSHPKKSKKWAFAKYFGNAPNKKRWMFGCHNLLMLDHISFS